MANKKDKKHNHDGHWKFIIDGHFEKFIEFFMPDLYPYIDFSRKPDSLEKELLKISMDEKKKGTVINDKLMKIYLKDGNSCWILIHIEVQSSNEKEFPSRMHKYYYRIKDKYEHRKITAIAIYTGESVPENYDYYLDSCFGMEMTYKFNTYLVKDASIEMLMRSSNPFALVVLVSVMSSYKSRFLAANFSLFIVKNYFRSYGYAKNFFLV